MYISHKIMHDFSSQRIKERQLQARYQIDEFCEPMNDNRQTIKVFQSSSTRCMLETTHLFLLLM